MCVCVGCVRLSCAWVSICVCKCFRCKLFVLSIICVRIRIMMKRMRISHHIINSFNEPSDSMFRWVVVVVDVRAGDQGSPWQKFMRMTICPPGKHNVVCFAYSSLHWMLLLAADEKLNKVYCKGGFRLRLLLECNIIWWSFRPSSGIARSLQQARIFVRKIYIHLI